MKKLDAKYAVLYNFSYMSIGALMPLIGQYLKSIGYTGTQIGIVTATGTAAAIFATAFWGRIYNRSDRKSTVLMMLCIMAAASCLLLSHMDAYVAFIIVFGLMFFFQAPVMSLTDAFTVERMNRFGSLRAWGAVGFALGIFFAGNAADLIGIRSIFVFYIASFMMAAFMVWNIGKNAAEHNTAGRKAGEGAGEKTGYTGYSAVFRDRRVRSIIICAFFMGGTNVANNTYFSFLYLEGGGSIAGLGFAMLLMVGSEVPFMAWSEKLSAKFTAEKTILAAMAVSVVRFLLYGMGLPWWALTALSFSQGAVNGILLIEFVRYVSKAAPKGCESLAVSAYYVIGSNLSTIFCQTAGGFLLDMAGAWAVYLFFGLLNLTGLVLYIRFIFILQKKDKKSD